MTALLTRPHAPAQTSRPQPAKPSAAKRSWRHWRPGLTTRFVAVTVIVTVAIGFVVTQVTGAALRRSALNEEAQRAASLVSGRLAGLLRPDDFSAPLTPARFGAIDRAVRDGMAGTHSVGINLWTPGHTVVYSTDRRQLGRTDRSDTELASALDGRLRSAIRSARAVEITVDAAHVRRVMEIYVPLRLEGSGIVGAFELYRDLHNVDARIATAVHALTVALACGLAALLLAVLLVARGASRQLRRQADELARLAAQRELVRRQAEFVGVVSHEVRTPLTALVGFSELLLTDDLPTTERREWTRLLHSGARRLQHLVGQLLDLSQLDEADIDLMTGPVSVPDAVNEAMEPFSALPPSHRLTWKCEPGLPPVAADRDKLVQILVNLISNAVKYSPDGGVVDIEAERADDMVRLRVSDEGMGIPAAELASVFERFHRVDDERLRGIEGTGLGLSITRMLVELHGGRIYAANRPAGRGCTFTVELPIAAGAEHAAC